MAEQVQSILERMVLPLKDLRNRGLFSPNEIRSIVERRRQSEYLLQRRSEARKSDFLRYIEEEIMLERLRKLRKEKVLTEMKNERMNRRHRQAEDGDDDGSDGDDNTKHNKKHAYQTSGPGDSHILSHTHFLYQRTLKKFHYPLDVLLNYAQFSKDYKSFHMLSRIYAEGLQHHPREAGLWIEAASFEYFGYVAQDYENGNKINSKVVGSSIQNARVLMQRGLRINKTSADLWQQYFALELHYVQKLRGRREILELGLNEDGMLPSASEDESDDEEARAGKMSTLLPSQIIFKNAIKAIPDDIQFRLRFVEACRMFPHTKQLEEYIMESVTQDFGKSVEGWVARISYAEEEWQKKITKKEKRGVMGFLGKADDNGSENDGNNGSNDGDESDGRAKDDRPPKKARVETESKTSDPALILLQEALQAVSTPNMYLEGARFLRLRIQRLLDNDESSDEDEAEEDVSHLIGKDEDANGAAQRHAHLLEELYENAKKKNISSTNLTLDHVDYLLSAGQSEKAEELLSNAVSASTTDTNDARLWLRWAEISQQMEEAASSGMASPSSSPTRILRRALKLTPIHDRQAHTLILTELMQYLMVQPSLPKTSEELNSLFQKLILLSQGSICSINVKKSKFVDGDEGDDEEGIGDGKVNLATTFVAYLEYAMLNGTDEATDIDAVRSIYTSILYHSNYGKSCSGKTEEEVLAMKTFFDVCLQFELANRNSSTVGGDTSSSSLIKNKKDRKEKKKAWKMRLCKLYETAIGFYESGGSFWRNVVDEYQRDLHDMKYSF